MAKGWDSVRLDEIDPIAVVDGTLLWRPIRRTLDIGAFGINAYVAPNAGDDVVEEHVKVLECAGVVLERVSPPLDTPE